MVRSIVIIRATGRYRVVEKGKSISTFPGLLGKVSELGVRMDKCSEGMIKGDPLNLRTNVVLLNPLIGRLYSMGLKRFPTHPPL